MQEAINRDEEHLKLLSIFHYVVGSIATIFGCFPVMHLIIGIIAIVSPESMTDKAGNLPPPFIGWIFAIIGGGLILLGWGYAVSLILTGRFIARRKHHLFCLIIAGLSCLFFPFGTILGVFTIIVLMRPSVKEQFK